MAYDVTKYLTKGEATTPEAPAQPVPVASAATPEAATTEPNAPHTFAGPHLIQDAHTGQHLVEDNDGGIYVLNARREVEKLPAAQAGAALADSTSGYIPASPDAVKEHAAQQKWEQASLAAKSDYVARQLLVGVADGVTAVPRLGAKLLGASPELDQKLSGENIVRKLDAALAGDETATAESEGARALAPGAPGLLNTAIDVGGFVLGGAAGGAVAGKLAQAARVGSEALGLSTQAASKLASGAEALSLEGAGAAAGRGTAKLAESLGMSAEKAAKLGAYADTVAQGAAIGGTQAAHEAWVNDEQLTAEAQWHAIGLGALLGVGGHATLDAMRGLPRLGLSAAEKVFGKPRVAAELGAGADASAQELAEGLTGVKQPEGIGGKVKQLTDWMQDKIQTLQAKRTGAKLEDIKEYGALGPKHAEAEALYKNRDTIFDQGARDLRAHLEELHSSGQELTDQVADAAMKKEHMARLLSDVDHAPIMQLAKDKAAEFQSAYENLDNVSGRGRTLLGKGKQLADIKAAYEDAIDGLANATQPADVTSALDQFKRATQRAKVNAEITSSRVASGVERNQALARSELMRDVSEKTRALLEDSNIFGRFGEAQAAVNSRWNAVLDSDRYIRSQLFENTGQISQGANFGRARYEISPQKVESYLNGLGTARSERLDSYLRDNITARKALADALGEHYDLAATHSVAVQSTKAAADKSLDLLKSLDNTLRVTNIYDDMLAKSAAAKGHGSAGAAMAAMAGHMLAGGAGSVGALAFKALDHVLSNPANFTKQMLLMRDAAVKLTNAAEKSVGRALGSAASAGSAATEVRSFGTAVRTLSSRESQEKLSRRYITTASKVAELAANPQQAIESVANVTHDIEHPGVQQALVSTSMNAIGFLASKLPKPLYQDSVTSHEQLKYVSQTDRDKFMSYAAAVNAPQDFFKDLAKGMATPEQAETAAALMPAAYAKAQSAAIMAFAGGKVKANYQVRLNVQRMLGIQVQPTASGALQTFLQQSAQQAAQQQSGGGAAPTKPKSKGAPSAATNLESSLSNLKV